MSVNVFQQGLVRGFFHEPTAPANRGLVLTHGAGANCQTPLLIAVADAFCTAGLLVLRFDLPFRQKRPHGPPMPVGASEDRAGLREAVSAVRKKIAGPVFVGGHSYGGRQATLLCAEDPGVADALLLLSYPLHPPNRPEQLRTAHWPNLRTFSFFVHGTKDPFGSIEEIQAEFPLMAAQHRLVPIAGAGHDLASGKFDIQNLVVAPFLGFLLQ